MPPPPTKSTLFPYTTLFRSHRLARRRPGRGRETLRHQGDGRPRVDHRMEQLVQVLGWDALHRLARRDEPLLHHFRGSPHRREPGTLTATCLSQIQLAVLEGER